MARRSEADLLGERDQIAIAKRDPAAFTPLYERYVDQIYAYVYTITRNREFAEDVTAATFARAIEELPRFEWRGVPYSAWLYRVASNLIARQKRRPGWVELSPHLPETMPGPEATVEASLRAADIRAAVAELPADQRQVVTLRFSGDLRNKEIADIVGRSEGAVKLLTFRALTTLRKKFGRPSPF